jgi:hypothetical protein
MEIRLSYGFYLMHSREFFQGFKYLYFSSIHENVSIELQLWAYLEKCES